MKNRCTLLAAVAAFAIAAPAKASTIFAPTSAIVNIGGSNQTNIIDTINQNGLSAGYTSDVTNFDAYIASNPLHTTVFTNEWFSDLDVTTARVTYDFGDLRVFDRLALWNEEFSGIGLLSLSGSSDGVTFTSFAANLSPIDNPLDPYLAEVLTFAATTARYVRFDMSRCPQPNPAGYNGCGIGEVAFRNADVTGAIPEPATWAMIILGFGAIGSAMRRRPAVRFQTS
ncbi:MAG: PEPxxWA-CTERM sorting domain-containing protein [Sphingomonadaceae bacterium]